MDQIHPIIPVAPRIAEVTSAPRTEALTRDRRRERGQGGPGERRRKDEPRLDAEGREIRDYDSPDDALDGDGDDDEPRPHVDIIA